MLTQQRLKELLRYDPETGVFTWLPRPARGRTDNTWNSRWAGKEAGWLRSDGYISLMICYKKYQAHRVAWFYIHGVWPAGDLDHADRNKTHNWIANLRPTDRSHNTANGKVRVTNKLGLRGVSQIKGGRYSARINKGAARLYIGTFDTKEEAHAAYCERAKQMYGEFACNGAIT